MGHAERRRLLLLLTCVLGCSSEEKDARVELASDRVDLGVLEPGDNTFLVKFTNAGLALLRVDHVGSTCSCTRAEATSVVAPGGTGEVRGNVTVQGGPGGTNLSLVSNDSQSPKTVHIRWFGKSSPTLIPDALDVKMRVGESTVQAFEISYPAGDPPKPLTLLGVSGLPVGAKVEMVADDPRAITSTPGLSTSFTVAPSPFIGKSKFQLSLPSASTPGVGTSSCMVKVGLSNKTFDLPLRLITRVDEGLRISPERMIFSASDFDSLRKIRRTAIVTSVSSPDRIHVVEKPNFLDVALSEVDRNASFRQLTAQVTLPPPAEGTDQRIILEDSSGKRISISILIGLGR